MNGNSALVYFNKSIKVLIILSFFVCFALSLSLHRSIQRLAAAVETNGVLRDINTELVLLDLEVAIVAYQRKDFKEGELNQFLRDYINGR